MKPRLLKVSDTYYISIDSINHIRLGYSTYLTNLHDWYIDIGNDGDFLLFKTKAEALKVLKFLKDQCDTVDVDSGVEIVTMTSLSEDENEQRR